MGEQFMAGIVSEGRNRRVRRGDSLQIARGVDAESGVPAAAILDAAQVTAGIETEAETPANRANDGSAGHGITAAGRKLDILEATCRRVLISEPVRLRLGPAAAGLLQGVLRPSGRDPDRARLNVGVSNPLAGGDLHGGGFPFLHTPVIHLPPAPAPK